MFLRFRHISFDGGIRGQTKVVPKGYGNVVRYFPDSTSQNDHVGHGLPVTHHWLSGDCLPGGQRGGGGQLAAGKMPHSHDTKPYLLHQLNIARPCLRVGIVRMTVGADIQFLRVASKIRTEDHKIADASDNMTWKLITGLAVSGF